MSKLKKYPTWVCSDCGKAGLTSKSVDRYMPEEVSTFHKGICGVCGKELSVTQPRDYGYPKFKGCEL